MTASGRSILRNSARNCSEQLCGSTETACSGIIYLLMPLQAVSILPETAPSSFGRISAASNGLKRN
eukprot:953787-Alexandrium_andersonii.AAC.1